MNYFSAFSGIGGFELWIQRVLPDAKCIGYSEIDKFAIKTYSHHFPDHQNYLETQSPQ
jgi:site-specific DNA-cytosine methylase